MALFFLALLVTGCGGAVNPPDRLPPKPTAEPGLRSTNQTLPSAGFQLQPQPEPGVYELAIQWDTAALLADEVWIEKTIKGRPKEFLHRSDANQGSYQDKALRFGELYDYQVFATSDGRIFPLGALSFTLPEDWVVPEGEHAWVPRPLGRLFLSKGSVIRLEEKDLSLDLLELHSDGGTIETFREGEAAALAGRKGGKIHIKAGLAVGNIVLASRGEAGGPGAPGQPGKPGSPGANGGPEHRAVDEHSYGSAMMQSRIALPKEGWTRVVVPRTPATDGQTGEPGSPGANGAEGGASGGVRLEVDKAYSLLPKVISQGGAGGLGGSGGAGGEGGEGGLIPDLPALPHPLMGGRKGATGAPGIDGTPGKKGADGPLEIFLGGRKVL